MRSILAILLSLLLVASFATAKIPHEKPDVPYNSNGRAAEVEPNDDYLTANLLIPGDDMTGAIEPAGEVDFFALTVASGKIIALETHAGDIFDTKLYLYDVDGTTELAFDEDGGSNWYSLITYTFADAGTYFVKVAGYNSSTTGTYILTATEEDPPPPPPANDVCEGAIDIQVQSLTTFDVDLAGIGYTNVSPMGYGGCTGFSANGPDAFYKIYLVTGETFMATEDGECDMSLYMFTDCADPLGSCVAGSDNCCANAQELISYDAEADGWYYIGVDAYSAGGCIVTIEINAPVANENAPWGSVKSLYR